jgi:hypothetical protein
MERRTTKRPNVKKFARAVSDVQDAATGFIDRLAVSAVNNGGDRNDWECLMEENRVVETCCRRLFRLVYDRLPTDEELELMTGI